MSISSDHLLIGLSTRVHLLERNSNRADNLGLSARVDKLEDTMRRLENKDVKPPSSNTPRFTGFALVEVARLDGIFDLFSEPVEIIHALKDEMQARTALDNFELLIDAEDLDKLHCYDPFSRHLSDKEGPVILMSIAQKLKAIARMARVDSIVMHEDVTYPHLRASKRRHLLSVA